MGAVTANCIISLCKWLPESMANGGAKLIEGKGGMTSKNYKSYFVLNGAAYLSIVGYGMSALLGHFVESVEAAN